MRGTKDKNGPMSTSHNTNEPIRPVLTIAEVCDLLRIKRSKCNEMIRSGQLESFRLGGRCRRIVGASVAKLIEGENA
ncbi:MAG: helix-turn-helix domain-containing protein [Fimbriimonadaceae bacterium]|nr:helix-turn-helix domain-containing protein [Fimbriimonadaceae bacterium]